MRPSLHPAICRQAERDSGPDGICRGRAPRGRGASRAFSGHRSFGQTQAFVRAVAYDGCAVDALFEAPPGAAPSSVGAHVPSLADEGDGTRPFPLEHPLGSLAALASQEARGPSTRCGLARHRGGFKARPPGRATCGAQAPGGSCLLGARGRRESESRRARRPCDMRPPGRATCGAQAPGGSCLLGARGRRESESRRARRPCYSSFWASAMAAARSVAASW